MQRLIHKRAVKTSVLFAFGCIPSVAGQYIIGRADYPAGNQPSSVAVGDFNSDGTLDAAVTNYIDNTVSIYIGKKDSTFDPQVTYAVGESPDFVLVADLNGDGKPDLAIANYDGNSVSILLGNGDGTFQPHVDYATGFGSISVTTGYLNRDHKLDLVVSTSTLSVSVLLGRGDGTFSPQVSYQDAGGSGAGSAGNAVLADFNGDGVLDVAVPVPFENAYSILLGEGNGTFHTFVESTLPGSPTAVAAADLNHDGKQDLALTMMNAATGVGTVAILLGNGDGTFQTAVVYEAGPGPTSVSVADLNRDGKLDLAVVDSGCGTPCEFGSISVLLGNGDGTFQPQSIYGTGIAPALAIADFNHDGNLDFAISHQTCIPFAPCGPGALSILLGNGNGTFPDSVPIAFEGAASSAATADFNSDGNLDLVVVNTTLGVVSILLGNGHGAFKTPVDYSAGTTPAAVAIGDFNKDGIQDLAVTSSANIVSILLGKGDGTFQPAETYAAGNLPTLIVTGDFNGDGNPDLAIVNNQNSYGQGFSVLLGNGNGSFGAPVSYPIFSLVFLAAGDFNGDGISDVVASTADSSPATIALYLGTATGRLAAPLAIPADFGGGLAAGDFNADGQLDLAVTDDCNCSQLEVLLGNGNGTFQSPVSYTTGNGPDAVMVGYFTGNRKLDIATANIGDGTVSILPGNGDGTFQTHLDYNSVAFPSFLAVGDFNGDSTEDILSGGINAANLSELLSVGSIAIFPGKLTFGSESVGKTSPPMVVSVANSGSTLVKLLDFSVEGVDASDFHEANACPSLLTVTEHCSFNVTFTPSETGTRTGNLTIHDTAPNPPKPQKVPLQGTGN